MYEVKFSKRALKALSKMVQQDRMRILSWIDENLEGTSNPRLQGKPLVGDLTGRWRYRIGNFRLIAIIEDQIITINIVEIGHRKEVYR